MFATIQLSYVDGMIREEKCYPLAMVIDRGGCMEAFWQTTARYFVIPIVQRHYRSNSVVVSLGINV